MRDELEKIADQALPGEDWPGRIARARRSRRQRWLLTTLSVVAAIAVPSIVLTSSDRAAPSSVTVGPSAPSTSASPPASVSFERACTASSQVQHLDAQQGPVAAAFICIAKVQTLPNAEIRRLRVVRQVTGGLEEFVRVYATADDRSAKGHCTSELPFPLVVYLHSDAAVEAVRAPVTPCGKPIVAARQAYAALTTVEVWTDTSVAASTSSLQMCSQALPQSTILASSTTTVGEVRAFQVGGPAPLPGALRPAGDAGSDDGSRPSLLRPAGER